VDLAVPRVEYLREEARLSALGMRRRQQLWEKALRPRRCPRAGFGVPGLPRAGASAEEGNCAEYPKQAKTIFVHTRNLAEKAIASKANL
jgi:hypothetical protein